MTEPPVLVLCVDGGGIRGLGPALILERLEREIPDLQSRFALVAGTSTGAIVATAIASGRFNSMTEVVDIYSNQAPEILSDERAIRRITKRPMVLPGLVSTLDTYLSSSMKLRDCKTPLIVPAFDIANRRAKFFSSQTAMSGGSDVLMNEVLLATIAAPTYLPPYKLTDLTGDDGGNYVDGGVFANDPSQIAIGEARKLSPDRQIRLLSLGCGRPAETVHLGNQSTLRRLREKARSVADNSPLHHLLLLTQVVDIFIGATTDAARQQSLDELGANYCRVDPEFRDEVPRLNDTSEEALAAITHAAEIAWAENKQQLVEFVRAASNADHG